MRPARFNPAPLAVAAAMAVALSAGVAKQARAQAGAGNAAPVAISIQAQPLAQALNELARQANLQLSFPPGLVAGKTAPAVSGRLTPQQALTRLLLGSGLIAVQEGLTVVISAAPATSESALPTITVTAGAEQLPGEPPKAYVGGQVARGSRLGILGNADVMDTPFSTKAYTAELVRQQGARSIDDVVANDPSIRTSLSSTFVLDQSSIRGFQVGSSSYLFDGVPGLFSYGRVAVQNFERIEIFKGPTAGLVGGLGSVGGTINLVPKRATDQPVRSLTLSAQDKSLAGAHADIGQRFGQDNVFGARLSVYSENGREYSGSKRELLAPQLSLDYRGERLRAMLDSGYIRYEMNQLGRNWTLRPGVAVPNPSDSRTNPMPSWWTFKSEQAFGLATVEWDFSDNWTGYARLGEFHEDKAPGPTPYTTALDGNGQFIFTGAGFGGFKSTTTTSDIGLRGKLKWGSVTHQLVFSAQTIRASGTEFSDAEDVAASVPGSIYASAQIASPFATVPPSALVVTPGVPTRQSDYAIADNVSLLDDRLKLTLAIRSKRIEQDAYDQTRVSPTVAALYKLTGDLSVYGNHAQALTQGAIAPDTAQNAGDQLAPYVSKQNEFGLKWDRGSYGLTAAYFDIRQTFAFTDASNVFRVGGEQQNRGVELETFGEPIKGLRVLGGVAWIDAKQTKTNRGATDGNKALGVPEFTANIGLEHDVVALPGLTLTGRVIHTGSAYVDLVNTQKLDGWNRVDVGARYVTKLASQTVTLRTGVSNVFDKAYWQTGGRNILVAAPPRTWQLSATVDF